MSDVLRLIERVERLDIGAPVTGTEICALHELAALARLEHAAPPWLGRNRARR